MSIFRYFLRLLHLLLKKHHIIYLEKQSCCVIQGWFINYFTIANKKFQVAKKFYQEVLILGYANI